jgi:hypothetical protein
LLSAVVIKNDIVEYNSTPKVVLPLKQGMGSSDNDSLDSE